MSRPHCAPPELGVVAIGVTINILLLRSVTRFVAALPRCASVLKFFSDNNHDRGPENHRDRTEKSLNQTCPLIFFSNLMAEL